MFHALVKGFLCKQNLILLGPDDDLLDTTIGIASFSIAASRLTAA